MAIPQSKKLYEPCSIAHFEALEQTQVVCGNFHGLETNTYFPVNGVDQAHSTGYSRILTLVSAKRYQVWGEH
jgi:hypothetical protein